MFTARSGTASDDEHRVDLDARERFHRLRDVWKRAGCCPSR